MSCDHRGPSVAPAPATYQLILRKASKPHTRTTMYRVAALLLLSLFVLPACSQYRLASLQDVEIPNYEPRPVTVPQSCAPLIERAAAEGMTRFSESEANEVLFCQQQQIIRAQEEEAAAKRLEAHAQAARFGLQMATVVITGLIATLAWIF